MRERSLRGQPLVEVTRGDLVESVHRIAACAIDAGGNVTEAIGDIDALVFLRSSAKPFIAAAAIAAGARERFGLEDDEIAIMAASHTGQAFHVTAVRSILRKIGLDENALACGAHAPYNAQAALDLERSGISFSAVHNNCSGKHAGILALAKLMGADTGTYMDPRNPAEIRILELCAQLSGVRVDDLRLGIDGCGIPVYATPLRNAALSFMRFATLSGVNDADARALQIVRTAMMEHPQYVSGTSEFDTRLMEVTAGSLCCKGGAEGVHGDAAISAGIGFVLKVIDGAARGRAPATLASLHRLGVLGDAQVEALSEFAHPVLRNRAGRPVGEIRTLNPTEEMELHQHLV
ncbi:MAG: asparaginase [Candidatus Eremiobacteraeota bacterium]|nr:asparaginase [Candidatus Eremiobacteraeota bacterium]